MPKDFKTYIEPFVGGGALYFYLNFKGNNVISDIHADLINFYKVLQSGYNYDIIKLMEQYNNDEKTYYYIRDEFQPTNDIERAFVFYYLRLTCYRGMLRYNKSGKFNVPFGRYKTYNFKKLFDEKYVDLLKRTTIYNKSFEEIFHMYNSEDNFMFLDPPYDSKFSNYGFGDFGKNDHILLSELFKTTKNKCLMVIGASDLIYKLYDGYICDKFYKKYSFKLHGHIIGDEINNYHLIIKNY